MAKQIVRSIGYMFDKLWQPNESFEFNGPKSTWFAPEGEEPRVPVNVDAVLNRPMLNMPPDEKDREIARLQQMLKEAQGAPHHQAGAVPHGPVTAPVTPEQQRRDDEAQRMHQPDNPTLTPEQRRDAGKQRDEMSARDKQREVEIQKAEADQRAKEEAERRKKEADKK